MVYDNQILKRQHMPDVCVPPAVFYTITIMLVLPLSHTDGKMKWSIAKHLTRTHFIPMASNHDTRTCVRRNYHMFAWCAICLGVINTHKLNWHALRDSHCLSFVSPGRLDIQLL